MTQEELNKLYKSIATDFKVVVRKTELWHIDYCYEILHDVKKFMLFNYADTISIIMHDQFSTSLKVKKYKIGRVLNSQNDRPGGIDWEDGDGHGLSVIIMYTDKYKSLSDLQRQAFSMDNLRSSWYPSGEDVNFPHLSQQIEKRYVHGNSGVDRIDFN